MSQLKQSIVETTSIGLIFLQACIATMVHYCEKLMGVVVFAKVQGPEGSADFQTLQVRGPL